MVPWERVAVCVKAMATGFYAPYAGSRICTCFILPSWGPSWELSKRGRALYVLGLNSVALDFRLRLLQPAGRSFCSQSAFHSFVPLPDSTVVSVFVCQSPGRALLSWRCIEEQHYFHHTTTPATELHLTPRYWTGLWAQLACLSSPSYGALVLRD